MSQIICPEQIPIAHFDSDSNQHWGYGIEFDSTDTNNIWQVGVSNKTALTSVTPVLMTDTLNSYPLNDTSVVSLRFHSYTYLGWLSNAEMSGYYKVESDSLNDFGKLELSFDDGNIWIDVLNDPLYSPSVQWYSNKPVFTGNNPNWQFFHFDFSTVWVNYYGIHGEPANGIDFLSRFTFVSDSILENLDGWMLDSLQICMGAYVGVEEHGNEVVVKTFPNPSSQIFTVQSDQQVLQYEVYSITGALLISQQVAKREQFSIPVSEFKEGFYILRLKGEDWIGEKRFEVMR